MSEQKTRIAELIERLGFREEVSFYLPESTEVDALRTVLIDAIYRYHAGYPYAPRAFELGSRLRCCNTERALLNCLGDFLNKYTTSNQGTHHPLIIHVMEQLFLQINQATLIRVTALIREQIVESELDRWKNFEFSAHFLGENAMERSKNLTKIFGLFSSINAVEEEGYLRIDLN
ncbi:MAG: hypothetical protein P1U32_08525 [Legionellaceae bacterium]|nr:hypothetical protein [Legionellaceae bacterium]